MERWLERLRKMHRGRAAVKNRVTRHHSMRKTEESDGEREKRQGSFGTLQKSSPASGWAVELRREIRGAWRHLSYGSLRGI
jgi:hypothetical protein